MMKILLLSTGSVSAYLSHKLAFMLKEDGHEVKHCMTKAAGQMMALSKGSNSKNAESQTFYTDHFSNYISIEREALDWHDNTGHHKRVVFYVLPTDYSGTMFTTIQNKRISKGSPFWVGRNIAEAYKCCIASYSVSIFWIVWIVVTIGAVVGFFVLDNDWLED